MSPSDVGMLLFLILVVLPGVVWAWRLAVLIKDIAVVTGAWVIQEIGRIR